MNFEILKLFLEDGQGVAVMNTKLISTQLQVTKEKDNDAIDEEISKISKIVEETLKVKMKKKYSV